MRDEVFFRLLNAILTTIIIHLILISIRFTNQKCIIYQDLNLMCQRHWCNNKTLLHIDKSPSKLLPNKNIMYSYSQYKRAIIQQRMMPLQLFPNEHLQIKVTQLWSFNPNPQVSLNGLEYKNQLGPYMIFKYNDKESFCQLWTLFNPLQSSLY